MPDDPNLNPPDPAVELDKKIADTVNAAITSHLKRYEKSSTEGLAKLLDERFAAFKPTPPPEPDSKSKSKDDPEREALKQKLDDLTRKYDETEKARAAAELARRDDSTFSRVKSLLKDVRPELQETAAKILFSVDKRVTFDEQGNPLFKVRKSPYSGAAEEDVELPLEDGINHWMKSEEAKVFRPAPQASGGSQPKGRSPLGSGSQTPGRGSDGRPTWDKPASTDEEKIRRSMQVEKWINDQK